MSKVQARGHVRMVRAAGLSGLVTTTTLATLLGLGACDDKKEAAGASTDAARETSAVTFATPAAPANSSNSGTSGSASPLASGTSAPRDAGPVSTWDGSMPERPVPRAHPTVGSGMPAETQMKAIAYMASMSQPRYDDAYIDPAYVKTLSDQLKPIALSMDKGSAADKAKVSAVNSVAGGRRIELVLAAGCDAELPGRAVQGRAGASYPTLLSHGVLVIACRDAKGECLQSTRDPGDVLCTRHR